MCATENLGTERMEKGGTKNEESESNEEEAVKKKILSAGLDHVGRHGWTRLALAAGAESAGYISVVSGLFPRDEELVFYHVRESNARLDVWMEAQVLEYKSKDSRVPVGRFIRSAVEERLKMNQEFIKNGRWQEALAIMAKPQNLTESVGLLQQVSDDIWFRAGDLSADLNWYSKRILLAGVISSTEIFMLQDTSLQFKDTWAFLDRRFEDIAGIPQLGNLPQDVTGILSGLAVTARNMAGMQK
jgi:ubiquinone biosynthesis protein COQ9